MVPRADLWVVVLAGGEGRRVRELTRDARGRPVPKQFCHFGSDRSLLRRTLERAARITTSERIVVVVCDPQRPWWEVELADHPPRNIVSQPANRGTGVAILHAALAITARDSRAVVLVMPSDHEVADEATLLEALVRAVDEARPGRRLVLAGMEPEEADPDFGWIVPTPHDSRPLRGVATFVEKPERDVATGLAASGALVSSFILAATGRFLLDLYQRRQPDLLRGVLTQGADASAAGRDLDRLPTIDFSRDLLEHSRSRLGVVAVPPCGWTDLGTPERLRRWMNRHALELASAS